MKKRLDLQLFAEAEAAETAENRAEEQENTAGAANTAQNNENTEETGKNGRSVPKYSDEDLDAIIGRRLAAWKKQEEKKSSEAERLGRMSEAERANERIRVLEERLAESDRREAMAAMSRTARAMLQEEGINVSDELLSNLISDDADTTKSAVDSFVSNFKAAVDREVKARVRGETPKVGTTSGITREQIMAIQNRAERQQKIRENPQLFNFGGK